MHHNNQEEEQVISYLLHLLKRQLIEQQAGIRSKFIDASIWRGSVAAGLLSKITVSASSNIVTGLIPLMEAGSDVNKLDSTKVSY
jgi:hypothetical protein